MRYGEICTPSGGSTLGSGGTGPSINLAQPPIFSFFGSIVISLSRCCLPNDEGLGTQIFFPRTATGTPYHFGLIHTGDDVWKLHFTRFEYHKHNCKQGGLSPWVGEADIRRIRRTVKTGAQAQPHNVRQISLCGSSGVVVNFC